MKPDNHIALTYLLALQHAVLEELRHHLRTLTPGHQLVVALFVHDNDGMFMLPALLPYQQEVSKVANFTCTAGLVDRATMAELLRMTNNVKEAGRIESDYNITGTAVGFGAIAFTTRRN